MLRLGDATNFTELIFVNAAFEDARWILKEEDKNKPSPPDFVAFSIELSCSYFRGYHPQLWFRLDDLKTGSDELKAFVENKVRTVTFTGLKHDGEFVMQCYGDVITNNILVSTSLQKDQRVGETMTRLNVSVLSEIDLTTLTGFIEDLTSLVNSLYLR